MFHVTNRMTHRGVCAVSKDTLSETSRRLILRAGLDRRRLGLDIDNEVRGVKAMPAGVVVSPDGVVKTQVTEVFVRRQGRWWIEATAMVANELHASAIIAAALITSHAVEIPTMSSDGD
jgi:hypothetical protein